MNLTAKAPLWLGTGYSDLIVRPSSYGHINNAFGGCWSAHFQVGETRLQIEQWIEEGLGRHIETRNDDGYLRFTGFVNSIVATIDTLTITRGPLIDTVNQANITYPEKDPNTAPPSVGIPVFATANDTDSQARWAIWSKVIEIDEATASEGTQTLNVYLAEHALPGVSQQLRTGQGGLTATIECLGYVHFLKYPFNYTAVSGEVNATDKIDLVLVGHPNTSWLTFDQTNVDVNTFQVALYEDSYRPGLDVIRDVVVKGGAGYARWLFGVYPDFDVKYHAAPTAYEYQRRLSDLSGATETIGGSDINPIDVMPGKWLLISDLLPGREYPPTNLRNDPRSLFIESATYRMPHTVDLTGGTAEQLSAMPSRLGLSGISA